jgi:hypothetical protein
VFRSCLATRLPWARDFRPCDVTVGNVGFVTLLCRRSSQPGCYSVASLTTRASSFSTVHVRRTGVASLAQPVGAGILLFAQPVDVAGVLRNRGASLDARAFANVSLNRGCLAASLTTQTFSEINNRRRKLSVM